jgi:hypothetical protein
VVTAEPAVVSRKTWEYKAASGVAKADAAVVTAAPAVVSRKTWKHKAAPAVATAKPAVVTAKRADASEFREAKLQSFSGAIPGGRPAARGLFFGNLTAKDTPDRRSDLTSNREPRTFGSMVRWFANTDIKKFVINQSVELSVRSDLRSVVVILKFPSLFGLNLRAKVLSGGGVGYIVARPPVFNVFHDETPFCEMRSRPTAGRQKPDLAVFCASRI